MLKALDTPTQATCNQQHTNIIQESSSVDFPSNQQNLDFNTRYQQIMNDMMGQMLLDALRRFKIRHKTAFSE